MIAMKAEKRDGQLGELSFPLFISLIAEIIDARIAQNNHGVGLGNFGIG